MFMAASNRIVLAVALVLLVLSMTLAAPAGAVQPRTEATVPAQAAVFYSQLEAEGRFSELYTYMHPDAQAIIPEAAVVGWYRDNFAPLGPGVITVTGMQIVSWTWGVTGTTYPETAEIVFQQPFADGSVANEVVRLVQHEGEWRWFFGRSRDFIDEQIAIYSGRSVPSGTGSCDGAAPWWGETFPRIFPAEYLAYTGNPFTMLEIGEQYLRDYASAFSRLYVDQATSIPPPAAIQLQTDLLEIFDDYEYALSTLADIASGNQIPLVRDTALIAAIDAFERGNSRLLGLDATIDAFLTACDPVIVFIYGMGEDLPVGVLPGEVGPDLPAVECSDFDSRADAQRFFEAAGTGDPHGLDRDGDGIACN